MGHRAREQAGREVQPRRQREGTCRRIALRNDVSLPGNGCGAAGAAEPGGPQSRLRSRKRSNRFHPRPVAGATGLARLSASPLSLTAERLRLPAGGLDRKKRRRPSAPGYARRIGPTARCWHGIGQEEAHRALIPFLQGLPSARDCAIRLVGNRQGAGLPVRFSVDERGVLASESPARVRAQELAPFVVGFRSGCQHHVAAGRFMSGITQARMTTAPHDQARNHRSKCRRRDPHVDPVSGRSGARCGPAAGRVASSSRYGRVSLGGFESRYLSALERGERGAPEPGAESRPIHYFRARHLGRGKRRIASIWRRKMSEPPPEIECGAATDPQRVYLGHNRLARISAGRRAI